MRVTKQALEAHRQNILTAAGKLFRARGVDAVPVAEIMKEAGLTHGGFYGHYGSKLDLAAESCRNGLADSAAKWRVRAADARAAGEDPIAAIASAYLAEARLVRSESSCAIPTMGVEAARAGPPLSTALADGLRGLLQVLEDEAPPGLKNPHTAALAAMSALVGGLVVARAGADPDLARQVLDAARDLAVRAFHPTT